MDRQVAPNSEGERSVTEGQVKAQLAFTYSFLASGILVTGLTLAALGRMDCFKSFVGDHLLVTVIVVTLMMTLTTSVFNSISYKTHRPAKALAWLVICALCAIPLLSVALWVSVKSAMYTAVLFVILSLKSLVIPTSVMEAFVSPLFVVHSVVIACSALSLLLGSSEGPVAWLITSICLHGGFLVYSGLLICNTQRLRINARHPNFDPLFSAFVLYMNLINLFSRVSASMSKNLPPEPDPCPCCAKVK